MWDAGAETPGKDLEALAEQGGCEMSNPVVIVGISGFGRETADVLDAMGTPIAGFVDDGPNEANLEAFRHLAPDTPSKAPQ